MRKAQYIVSALSSALLLTVVATHATQAEPSKCKGLDETHCAQLEVIPGYKACNWIKGHKTVAGTETKSYCRASTKAVK